MFVQKKKKKESVTLLHKIYRELEYSFSRPHVFVRRNNGMWCLYAILGLFNSGAKVGWEVIIAGFVHKVTAQGEKE